MDWDEDMDAFTVALDGPAAAGKGTIGRAIANKFGFEHLDTGLLYRAVAKKIMDQGDSIDEEIARKVALDINTINFEGLRSAEVGREASRVAAMPSVRETLFSYQRNFARREGGAVLDGRDIATVIVPEAEVKIFVTASEKVRARRRFIELQRLNSKLTYDEVLSELKQRDERDTRRGLAALRKDEEALLLDTSKLTIEEAVNKAIAVVSRRIEAGLVS